MSKPNWCPQALWDETGMKFDLLYDAEPDLEGGCEQGVREMAARVALAAVEEEREVCAAIAADYHDHPNELASFIGEEIASAIRARKDQ